MNIQEEKLFTLEDMRNAFQAGKDFGSTEALFNNTDTVSRHQYENTPDFDEFIASEYKDRC